MPSIRLRVLIADSQPMLAVGLEAFVNDLGHLPVEVVHTGQDALTAAARYRPDLLITDVVLDGPISGISAAQRMKEQFGTRTLFFSGQSDPQTRRLAQLAEPLAFIDKTTPPADLARAIEAFASTKQRAA